MVSILVPVYNAEKFLHRCMDSIIRQSYTDIEIIAVNDGSRDNSGIILRDYANLDKRIRVVTQENKGVAAARNAGLQKAAGEFILYVDADDWIEPNMLARMLMLADDADIVFCGNDTAENYEDVKHIETIEIENWDQARQQYEFIKHKRMTGMLWNKLIRKSITAGCLFNEKTGYGEDAEFLWQVLKNSQKMVVTNEILYHHADNPTSISALAYSEKKYSAIPMWEKINSDVKQEYPHLVYPAEISLMRAAVYGHFEARKSGYKNQAHIRHMRELTRENIAEFLKAKDVSIKFKLYALAVCLGY